jgi:hypothetical protein
MRELRIVLIVAVVALITLVAAPSVYAQATRTWVSGVGDDANPCSRTAPCKTFAGAISKTAVNGEINCLDPGGYGAVTITKSITIDCEDTQGSILASLTTGVIVNITAGTDTLKTVRLRGLSINGAGNGIRGINFIAGAKLFVDELFIHGFANEGILINTTSGADVVVRDSVINNNAGSGIRATTTGGVLHVTVTRTTADLNQQGIRFENRAFGVVSHSSASNNSLNGFVVNPTAGGAEMNIVDSTANNNKQFGVFAGGTNGIVRIFNLTAFHNTTSQLQIQAPGQIQSNTTNHVGLPTQAPGPFNDL